MSHLFITDHFVGKYNCFVVSDSSGHAEKIENFRKVRWRRIHSLSSFQIPTIDFNEGSEQYFFSALEKEKNIERKHPHCMKRFIHSRRKVTVADFLCLQSQEWRNGFIKFHFTVALMHQSVHGNDFRLLSLESQVIPRLMAQRTEGEVGRYLKGFNWHEVDYRICPLLQQSHWMLSIGDVADREVSFFGQYIPVKPFTRIGLPETVLEGLALMTKRYDESHHIRQKCQVSSPRRTGSIHKFIPQPTDNTTDCGVLVCILHGNLL